MEDLDKENIIKNPNRKDDKGMINPYVPEYIRHGLNPILRDFPSLDGEAISDLSIENSHIIDNNEKVNYGFNVSKPSNSKVPETGEYLLMVKNKIITYGDKSSVLAEAKAILYGEHKDFVNSELQVDDIIVLKRIELKVGIYFNE